MSEPNFFDTPIAFVAEHIGNLQQVLREGRKPTYAEVVLVKNLIEYLPELFDIATEDGDENGVDACLLAKQQLPIIVAGFMQSCGIDPTPVVNPGTDDATAKAAVLRLMAASMTDDGESRRSDVGASADDAEKPLKPDTNSEEFPQYVTLDQAGAMVDRSKHTLKKADGLPEPDIQGGGKGKPNEWLWSNIRPWLEANYDRKLPPRFPGKR